MPDTTVKLQDITPVKSTFDSGDQILLINPTGEARISKSDFADALPNDALTLIGDITNTGVAGGTVAGQITTLLNSKAQIITNTATGSIASFSDGSGYLFDSVVADINPVQDLNGYDNPWPAGGGKNLVNISSAVAEDAPDGFCTIGDDGSVTLNGTTSVNTVFVRVAMSVSPGNYVFSANNSATNAGVQFSLRNADLSSNSGWFKLDATNKTNAFTVSSTASYFQIQINTGTYSNFKFYPQLESGSTATDFAPYSNICPISGHTEVNVTRTGANVWDEEWEAGSLSTSTGAAESDNAKIRSKNFCACKPGTTYCKVCVNPATYVWYYDIEKNFISFTTSATTFTTPGNCYYFKIRVGDLSHPQTTYNNDISINYPSSDTSYHAYSGTSLTADWQTEAGTVYGGTIDVATGVLTVDKAMVTLNGTESYEYTSAYGGFRIILSDAKIDGIPREQLLSDKFVGAPTRGVYGDGAVIRTYSSINDDKYVFICGTEYTDVNDFKTWLASNPTQLVYPIATPQTYQLTPQQLATLYGNNNVWSDTGNVTVAYPADTKKYIDNAIAAAIS